MNQFAPSSNFAYGFPVPGPQSPTSQEIMNNIFFLTQEQWENVRLHDSFDYIVIGTGFCGFAFAKRVLDQNPKARILMIERGGFFLPEHFQNLPLPFEKTLGGLTETFPWTLSGKTANQPAGQIQFQHGMIPFFGGRSIMWSAWCPRPTEDEMAGWPQEVIDTAHAYFPEAEKLLNVIPADKIDRDQPPEVLNFISQNRPVYGVMQKALQTRLEENLGKVTSATRSMPAPLAAGAAINSGIDFSKFSTPSVLLELLDRQQTANTADKGAEVQIITECIVENIISESGKAIALDTSRGAVNIGNAKVILAMGTLPPTTLLMNGFPELKRAGERFTAHFITSIVARIPRKDFDFAKDLQELEMAAIYMAGKNKKNNMQYHVQLSVLSDKDPVKNAQKAERYMPDVVATASMPQLLSSEDYLVFVCAVLGEMDAYNPDTYFRKNDGNNPTTNATLQVLANDNDYMTWDTMDEGTFQMLEDALSPNGKSSVEYWHGSPTDGTWKKAHPPKDQIRVGGLVHEGSTLHIGKKEEGVVGLDYRPHGTQNIYVTGGALWPQSGSWNPTMTMVALAQHLADSLEKKNNSK